MHDPYLSAGELEHFLREGYVLRRKLFRPEEIAALLITARNDPKLNETALSRRDGEGGITRLRLWNEAGGDIYGRLARCERIVRPMEQVLGGEVYFYHSKLNFKEPRTGGAWAWHQDYGYWYNNGCLYPLMASCMVALDWSTRENGCLQVIPRSHQLGRIDHGKVGDQTGADPDRVREILKVLPLVYCEQEPGDALFFHCNLLHRSDQNRSDQPRWTYILCYNAARNNPYKEHHHPRYQPLSVVADEEVLESTSTLTPVAAGASPDS